MIGDLKTGDLVLCKVGSFPPWPAVVFPQRLLRQDVYRKRRENYVAVCFFNDPTYYWEQATRLNPLKPAVIEKFLSQDAKVAAQKDLIEAYRQAQHFSDLNEFIVSRFTEEERLEELLELEGEEIKSGEDPFLGKSHSRKRKVSSSPSATVTSSSSKSKRKRSHEEANSSKNRAHEEDDSIEGTPAEGSGIVSNNRGRRHKRIHPGNDIPSESSEKKNKLDRSRRTEISLLFRRRIQKNLVQREIPPTEEELMESHKMLKKIQENLENNPPFFDLEALRESKLHKLFKVIVNDSNLEEFHAICKKVLIHWADSIAELKSEKVKKEQEELEHQQLQQSPEDMTTTASAFLS